ncbi:polymorphic toxin type 23 domain-containing protein [Brumimicrobium mesophilum]|uniref:polymorphic toxin type 23 domain-containing protein n=1 Tax=Brumimicrobium mesophilum TaxID=392717 RepID=UPI001F1A5ABA|nr:polymorphic toxin type 23 domain-containing protein [Brumimicrobium mesophilum]
MLSTSPLNAQKWNDDQWGIQVALTADLGTHINQIGLKVQGYYKYNFAQLNFGNHLRFNATHFGGRKKYLTQRINTGIVILSGGENSRPQLIYDGLNHQSEHNYALAYNYLWYIDNAGSSQRSGGFGFHIHQISLYIENDLFAGSGRDMYRTSHASASYHDDLYNFSLNTQLWTGDTRGTRLQNTQDSIYVLGYKDLSATHYGKTSHGILSLGFDHQINYGNHVSALVGIDSERIRHGLQNRFMHDKKFVPMRWRKPNVNYPMLNSEGFPVHYKEEAAPAKFFMQFGLNRSFSY